LARVPNACCVGQNAERLLRSAERRCALAEVPNAVARWPKCRTPLRVGQSAERLLRWPKCRTPLRVGRRAERRCALAVCRTPLCVGRVPSLLRWLLLLWFACVCWCMQRVESLCCVRSLCAAYAVFVLRSQSLCCVCSLCAAYRLQSLCGCPCAVRDRTWVSVRGARQHVGVRARCATWTVVVRARCATECAHGVVASLRSQVALCAHDVICCVVCAHDVALCAEEPSGSRPSQGINRSPTLCAAFAVLISEKRFA
jgi:hypothetical protein